MGNLQNSTFFVYFSASTPRKLYSFHMSVLSLHSQHYMQNKTNCFKIGCLLLFWYIWQIKHSGTFLIMHLFLKLTKFVCWIHICPGIYTEKDHICLRLIVLKWVNCKNRPTALYIGKTVESLNWCVNKNINWLGRR